MLNRLINILLRTIALGSRFVLTILLTKSMAEEDFGYYGLFSAAVAYLVYVAGMDFYTFTLRDLVTRHSSSWRALLRDQCLIYGVMYFVISGCALLLWSRNTITGNTLVWVLLVLATEHSAQELNRLLIIANKVLEASLALFIRSGLWVLVLAALWWLDPDNTIEIKLVLSLWLGGGVFAIFWSLWCLRDILLDQSNSESQVDWNRLKGGIQVSVVFFAGTLLLKITSTADRFLVEHFDSLTDVGPYVFYVGIASAIAVLVDAAVVAYDYPRLIEAWVAGEKQRFLNHRRSFFLKILFVSLGAALLTAILLQPVINFINKKSVEEAWPLAIPLIAANLLIALANVPHYSLYAAKNDKAILRATVISTSVFLFSAVIAGHHFGALGVAWSQCLSALIVLVYKEAISRRTLREKSWTFGYQHC